MPSDFQGVVKGFETLLTALWPDNPGEQRARARRGAPGYPHGVDNVEDNRQGHFHRGGDGWYTHKHKNGTLRVTR